MNYRVLVAYTPPVGAQAARTLYTPQRKTWLGWRALTLCFMGCSSHLVYTELTEAIEAIDRDIQRRTPPTMSIQPYQSTRTP